LASADRAGIVEMLVYNYRTGRSGVPAENAMTRSLALIVAVLLALPSVASARPRVALIKFDGDPGGEVQDTVSELLDGDTTLVGPKEVNRTVDKLGLGDDMSEKELKKLATELDADALVQGKIAKKGDNRVAHFKLFVHGKKKGFSIEFSNLKSKKLKETLHDKMLEKIGGGGDADDDKKDKKDKKAGKSKKDDDEADDKKLDDKKAAKKKKGDADEEDPVADKKAKAAKKKADDEEDTKKKADDKKADKADDKKADDKKSDEDEALATKKAKSEDEPPPKKKADADDEDAPRKAKKRTARRGDDDEEGVTGHSDDDDTAVTTSVHAANRVAVRVDLGISVVARKLSFTSRNIPEAPKGYTGKPVPGARLAGEVYPLAFQKPKSMLAGLGLGGDYDKTIGNIVQTDQQPGTKFSVNMQHWSVGPRFRVVFGDKPTSPTVTFAAGYGHRTFKVDRSAAMAANIPDFPDVDYKGVFPGLDVRIPLTSAVAFVFGGRALLLTGAGSIQTTAQYGQAKITGAEAGGGIDVLLGSRFALRFAFEFSQLGYAFTGTGDQAINRDKDPTSKDVGGAADRFVGGSATLAVLY
jgi:hypothetical protein